jgi:hypothetical protein
MTTASLLRTVPLAVALLSSTASTPLLGQWRVGLEVGAARFWGGSQESGGGETSFRPYRPTTFGAGLERQSGRYAFGLQVHYFQSSLGLEGPDLIISAEGVFETVTISPEAVVRLATLGGNELRIHAGPVLEVWGIVDGDTRTRFGGQGAVSLDVPLGVRFSGVVAAGVAATPSPYEEGELNLGAGAPTYELKTLWRRRLGLGLRYQL